MTSSLHANPSRKQMQNIHVIILLQMKNVNIEFFVVFEQKVYFCMQIQLQLRISCRMLQKSQTNAEFT